MCRQDWTQAAHWSHRQKAVRHSRGGDKDVGPSVAVEVTNDDLARGLHPLKTSQDESTSVNVTDPIPIHLPPIPNTKQQYRPAGSPQWAIQSPATSRKDPLKLESELLAMSRRCCQDYNHPRAVRDSDRGPTKVADLPRSRFSQAQAESRCGARTTASKADRTAPRSPRHAI